MTTPATRGDLGADLVRMRRNGALATFIGAVTFRVGLFYSGLVAAMFDTGDSPEYRLLADSLLRHLVFGFDGVPKMNRTPGYPAFLAVVFGSVGRSQAAVTGAQIALDALTCVLVFDLALRLRIGRAGVLAAAAAAVTCVFTSAVTYQTMTETLYSFGIVASVWLLPRGSITALLLPGNRGRVFAAGLTMGATTLVRPLEAFAVASLFGIVAVTLVWRIGLGRAARPRTVVALAVIGLGASLAIVPWMARNRIVFAWEFDKPNHDHVTLLGYKTDAPVYRHWYSKEFTFYRRSYEEPMVMETPYEAPSVARWVYADEPREVAEAFAHLSKEIRTTETLPITAETLAGFQRIGEKRYAAAPRLVVTAPLSRAAKLWVAPRASILLDHAHGGSIGTRKTVLFTLYDLLYVVPGFIGLVLAFRRGRAWMAGAFATILAHTAMHTFWHSSPHSRYMVPLFPFLCLGIGMVVDRVLAFCARRARRAKSGTAPAAQEPAVAISER